MLLPIQSFLVPPGIRGTVPMKRATNGYRDKTGCKHKNGRGTLENFFKTMFAQNSVYNFC